MAAAQTLTSDKMIPAACVCPIPERGQLPEKIYWAARHGLLDDVKAWLNEGGDVNAADHEGDTMLRGACRGGQNLVLRELLSYPNLHLNVRDGDGRTPLMKAARRGEQKTISMLCVANIKCTLDYTAADRKGNTALSLAVLYGHWEVALLLLQERHLYDRATLRYTYDLALKLEKTDIRAQMTNLGYSQLRYVKNITKVCILNYKQFRSRPDVLREGSEIDFMNLESLFTDLQYEVQGYWNLTKDKTLTTLKEFSQEHTDCVIVVIMSHGKSGPVFQTSDMKDISVTEVLNIFLDSKCPHLKGKPKIFLFNFCRETQESSGLTKDTLAEPPRDILCVYSTTESSVSYRYPEAGSPFITTLCEVIKKYANDDLDEILRRFNKKYMENITPEIQNFCFQERFYF